MAADALSRSRANKVIDGAGAIVERGMLDVSRQRERVSGFELDFLLVDRKRDVTRGYYDVLIVRVTVWSVIPARSVVPGNDGIALMRKLVLQLGNFAELVFMLVYLHGCHEHYLPQV